MLLEHSPAGPAVRLANMAAGKVPGRVESHVVDDDGDDDDADVGSNASATASQRGGPIPSPRARKSVVALLDSDRCDASPVVPEKAVKNVPEGHKKFRKQRQDDVRQHKRLLRHQRQWKRNPIRMEKLRHKFVEQCKRYFGVPYARKYWAKDTPEYKSPLFLDCCGLVRQVMRDMERDFGFRLGPWNQAYMYDTLPLSLTEAQMKPGDLVFMTGTYVNGKHKKQRHNMMHVEVWLGQGGKTIGARWNNGKVQVFESYRFNPKSFTDEQYYFRSIDTWLMGVCKSHCELHPWGLITYAPGKKSIFFSQQQDLCQQDQSAGDDEDDDDNDDISGNDVTGGPRAGGVSGSDGDSASLPVRREESGNEKEPAPPSPPSLSDPPPPSCTSQGAPGNQTTGARGKSGGSQRIPDDVVDSEDTRLTHNGPETLHNPCAP